MPYTITTRDGITLRNIPDDVPEDGLELKQRVAKIRAEQAASPTGSTSDAGREKLIQDALAIPGGSADPAERRAAAERRADEVLQARAREAQPDTLAGKLGSPLDVALTLASGALASMPGAVIQAFGSPEAAREFMEKWTRQPSTLTGQRAVEGIAKAAQDLKLEALPGIGGELAVLSRAKAPAVRAAADASRAVAAPVAEAVKASPVAARVADLAKGGVSTLPRRALEALRKEPEARPTPGTMGSAGAAGTDMAAQRVANAESLGFTGNAALTKGQRTRDPAQLKFESEASKMADEGARLRERAVEQNLQLLRNFDNMVDQTGAEAPTLRAVGQAVDKAVVEQAARDKTAIRVAYKNAEKAGEMEAPVTLQSVVDHLNESAPDAAVAPLLEVARRRAIQLGLAVEEGGQLVPRPVPLKTAETYRRAIGNATDFEPTNVRQSTIIKGLLDEATDGLGGDLYRDARKLRSRYAQNYENRATIQKLVSTKRGTSDRQVAFEDVLDHTVLRGSLDDVRNVRRVLHRSGADGQQAWRELQGATARHIKDEATKSVATDSAGNPVVSAAGLDKVIKGLDVDGRLDFIFGKRGAQQMRDLNDLAKYVKTIPPEAGVNTSNTAATLLSAFGDIAFSSISGAPVPIATGTRMAVKQIKDAKLRRRINDALDDMERKQAPSGKPGDPISLPRRGTLH